MKSFLLVANGGKSITESVRRVMVRHDYHVETAAGGLECLAKLRQAKPDVFALDLDIPWGGGEGVLEWLTQEHQSGARPVVLLSRTPPTEEVIHLLIPPVVQYLQKPLSLRVLLRCLHGIAKAEGLRPRRPAPADFEVGGVAALVH